MEEEKIVQQILSMHPAGSRSAVTPEQRLLGYQKIYNEKKQEMAMKL